MANIAGDSPDPIDVHVGNMVRTRRKLLRVSQADLADAIGVTFQQVQKYERGANRFSSSTLFRAAQKLEVRVDELFDGLEATEASGNTFPEFSDFMRLNGAVNLARAYANLPSRLRRQVVALVEAMSGRA